MIENYIKQMRNEKDSAKLALITMVLINYKKDRSNNRSLLPEMASILDIEDLSKLVAAFGGSTIEIPTRDELEAGLTEALCLYYSIVKGYDWNTIQKKIPKKFSAQGMSRRINLIHKNLQEEFKQLMLGGQL